MGENARRNKSAARKLIAVIIDVLHLLQLKSAIHGVSLNMRSHRNKAANGVRAPCIAADAKSVPIATEIKIYPNENIGSEFKIYIFLDS